MSVIEPLPESSIAIDNDVFTWLINKNSKIQQLIFENFKQVKQFAAIPSVVIFEKMIGLESALKNNKLTLNQYLYTKKRIEELLSVHPTADFNREAAEISAYICAQLGTNESNRMWYDIQIVATALAHNYALASGNTKDMLKIADNLPAYKSQLRLTTWKP